MNAHLEASGLDPQHRLRRSIGRAFVVGAVTLSMAGCGLWRPTRVPMRTISLPAACETKPSTLLVFLQGSYSMPEDWVTHGFVDGVRREHIAADVSLVDAHLGYYNERSILDRLRADVLVPARTAGYRDVWLVGISIGAYGALVYSAASTGTSAASSASTVSSPSSGSSTSVTSTASALPTATSTVAPAEASITGTVAIAPYLGSRGIAESIVDAGGLGAWHAPAVTSADEYDLSMWRWLQRTARERPDPRLYLGYGRDDRFAYNDRALAAALPASHVFTAPGGHDWPAWEDVWRQMLPALPLPRDASCRVSASQ